MNGPPSHQNCPAPFLEPHRPCFDGFMLEEGGKMTQEMLDCMHSLRVLWLAFHMARIRETFVRMQQMLRLLAKRSSILKQHSKTIAKDFECFQTYPNMSPAIFGLLLGQCWIVWPGLYSRT